MKTITKSLIALLTLSLSLMAQAQEITPMTHADLEKEFKRDVRYEYKNTSSSGKIEHAADGRIWVTGLLASNNSALNDKGTYVVRDGALCITWQFIRNGQEACFRFAKRDGQIVSLNTQGKEDGWRKEIK